MANEYGKAVENGQLRYTSASAMQRFRGCKASWYYRYVEGLEDPAGKSAILGTEAHARLEQMGKGVDVLTPHDRAAWGMAGPMREGVPEHPVEVMVDGVRIVGKIDVLGSHVLDWKFKGRLTDVDTTPKDLTDPGTDVGLQMLTYSHATGNRRVAHVYAKLGPGKAAALSPIEAVVTDESLNAWRSEVSGILTGMKEAAKATSALQVERNPNNCFKFHKMCAFASVCPAQKSTEDLFEGGTATVSLFNEIQTPEPVASILPPDAPPAPPLKMKAEDPAPAQKKPRAISKPVPPARAPESTTHSAVGSELDALNAETVLYFGGAFPIGEVTATLQPYVASLEAELLNKLGEKVPDVRLSEHKALAFGKWKATLGTLAKQGPPPDAHYVVSTEEKELIVAEALRGVPGVRVVFVGGR
jgi:hypothetical protein